MASAGYTIPVSASIAESTSIPQNQAAGTVFNFASPGASGDWYSQEANPINPATAVSSASTGGPSASAADGGVSALTQPQQSLPIWLPWTIAGGFGILAIVVILAMRK